MLEGGKGTTMGVNIVNIEGIIYYDDVDSDELVPFEWILAE